MIIDRLYRSCGRSAIVILNYVEILDIDRLRHSPRDEKPDNLGAGEFPPQHVPHRDEMRSGCNYVIYHGDHLRYRIPKPPIYPVATLEHRHRRSVSTVMHGWRTDRLCNQLAHVSRLSRPDPPQHLLEAVIIKWIAPRLGRRYRNNVNVSRALSSSEARNNPAACSIALPL